MLPLLSLGRYKEQWKLTSERTRKRAKIIPPTTEAAMLDDRSKLLLQKKKTGFLMQKRFCCSVVQHDNWHDCEQTESPPPFQSGSCGNMFQSFGTHHCRLEYWSGRRVITIRL